MISSSAEQAELIPKPECIDELLLSSFLSLLGGIFVEGKKVVVVVAIHSVYFVIDYPKHGEGVIIRVDALELIPHINKLVLHCEEATANH